MSLLGRFRIGAPDGDTFEEAPPPELVTRMGGDPVKPVTIAAPELPPARWPGLAGRGKAIDGYTKFVPLAQLAGPELGKVERALAAAVTKHPTLLGELREGSGFSPDIGARVLLRVPQHLRRSGLDSDWLSWTHRLFTLEEAATILADTVLSPHRELKLREEDLTAEHQRRQELEVEKMAERLERDQRLQVHQQADWRWRSIPELARALLVEAAAAPATSVERRVLVAVARAVASPPFSESVPDLPHLAELLRMVCAPAEAAREEQQRWRVGG